MPPLEKRDSNGDGGRTQWWVFGAFVHWFPYLSLSAPISLFFLWHAQPTSDDLVSSAECSSDDEDFVECEPSTGRLGQSCFACFIFSFAKNNTYIYVNIHVFYIYYSVLVCVFPISIYVCKYIYKYHCAVESIKSHGRSHKTPGKFKVSSLTS